MHRWIEELRRRRYFKQNWFIRPSKGRRRGGENELGLTCTFNYCCQGVCFALLGKANHRLYHPLKKKPKKNWRICNIKFTILSVVQHSPQLHRRSEKFCARLLCDYARCMVDKQSRMRPPIRGCSSHLVCSPEGWGRTKAQHVPVCLITLHEVRCTCRLLTRHGVVFFPFFYSCTGSTAGLRLSALLCSYYSREVGNYFHRLTHAHARTHTHLFLWWGCGISYPWPEALLESLAAMQLSHSEEARRWPDTFLPRSNHDEEDTRESCDI